LPSRKKDDHCQWWVKGECYEPAIRIIERRKQKPTDPDYNIGQLRVCWRHLDEASRTHKGYPYDVGLIIPCDYDESCLEDASVKLFLASLEDEKSLGNPGNYCDSHAKVIRKTHIVNKEEKLLTSSRTDYIR
jgi:hypothetical protein